MSHSLAEVRGGGVAGVLDDRPGRAAGRGGCGSRRRRAARRRTPSRTRCRPPSGRRPSRRRRGRSARRPPCPVGSTTSPVVLRKITAAKRARFSSVNASGPRWPRPRSRAPRRALDGGDPVRDRQVPEVGRARVDEHGEGVVGVVRLLGAGDAEAGEQQRGGGQQQREQRLTGWLRGGRRESGRAGGSGGPGGPATEGRGGRGRGPGQQPVRPVATRGGQHRALPAGRGGPAGGRPLAVAGLGRLLLVRRR
jgi:hypothetical protein